jgi:diaminopimelate decarboxylase
MFSGIGKTTDELAAAVDAGILCVNVESEPELDLLSSIAAAKGCSVDIAVRVNPDIDARTHAKIATGKAENKFGIPISRARDVYARAAKLPGVRVAGVDMHIGSQIVELDPFGDAFALLADFVRMLRADGHTIEHLDLGGGLGIPYRDDNEPPPDPDAYAALVKRATAGLHCKLIFEPGRLIVGNAGILITRVLYLKKGEAKTFIIVDAGMNDLIRPALYQSYHEIVPVIEPNKSKPDKVDIVGPVCESGDFFALNREMPELHQGDLLAIMSVGAYGFVMASNYNSRSLPAEVLVRGDKFALIRKRETWEDLLRDEVEPDW